MPEPLLLGVNIDHVATLRQARHTRYPEPLHAALVAEDAGADSITVHLREDRRHIQERDVELLSQVVQTRINLELAATDAMVNYAERLRPADCCLVPERREELTTEGGLDVDHNEKWLRGVCARLTEAGIRVSLFVDPIEKQIEASARLGVPVIELHTGAYAEALTVDRRKSELQRLIDSAKRASGLGLSVHAGHGLNYHNVGSIAAIAEIRELNIGHAIIARAIFSGLGPAVTEMKRMMQQARVAN